MMTKKQQERVQEYLDSVDPDKLDKDYEERGIPEEARAVLRKINEMLSSRNPEDILNYLDRVAQS